VAPSIAIFGEFYWGYLMKNAMATSSDLPHEYFVLQINGRISSTHRRFEDALRAGLLLKYQFPHDDIKVYETKSAEEVMPGIVFH
jgi:hypothetical protein